VRLQTQGTEYSGAIDCARKIIRNEGIFAFYKGTATPLFGVGAYVSVQFGMFHYLKRIFGEINQKRRKTELSGGQLFLSGFGAGVAASFVACIPKFGARANDRSDGTH
jgi:solute carrier family 25 (mitochondrial carnitine/acylcarnitine transporter), member 20/29